MWFLYVLSWLALFVQISFVTIAIAAGLYYLAELVEEYSVLSKRIIQWIAIVSASGSMMCHFVGAMCRFWDQCGDSDVTSRFCYMDCKVGLGTHIDLPTVMIACGILSQIAHLLILKTFPFVQILSPAFISALVLIFVNHYYAFQYFNAQYHTFSEVMAYFTLCLWLVPFALFVSLSANENVLPTVAETRPLLGNDVVSNYFSRREKKYGLLSLFNYAKDSILPQRSKKAF